MKNIGKFLVISALAGLLAAFLAFSGCSSPESTDFSSSGGTQNGSSNGGGGTTGKPDTPNNPSTPTNPSKEPLTGTVSISGNAQVGQTLTADTASLGGSGIITYQWNRSTTPISNANGSTYNVQNEDLNLTITVTVTRANNTGSVTSEPTDTVTGAPLPVLTGKVSISGNAVVGQILTANTDSLNGSGTIYYQWERDKTEIETDSETYTVQSADVGHNIAVTVTRSGYSGIITSDPIYIEEPYTEGLFFALKNNTAWSVSKGTANAANVVIPSSHEGKPVNEIANNGFSSYTNMTRVTIPNSITSIGESAFSGCTGLTEINYNATYCNDLTISNNVFYNAGKNAGGITVNIGANVTKIPAFIFYVSSNSGPKITSVNFAVGSICQSIGWAAFADTGLTNVTIPDSVTSIGNEAFADTGLTNVTIPSSVTSIGYSAFQGCTGLTSITIPNSVTSIGKQAFSGCSGLTGVYITDLSAWCKINFVEFNSNPLCYAHKLYINGVLATNITIPSSVTSIGNNAFVECTGLTSITIPNSVTSIGNYAFYVCTGLTSITIPDSVTSIGYCAFGFTGLTSITIPNSVTSIDDGAFACCTGLTSITLNNSVIGSNMFTYCTSLTSITIPNNVTSIGDSAFQGCTGLTSITLNNSVIGSNMFANCTSLTNITIPKNVKSINEYAFLGCTGLRSVTFQGTILSSEFNTYAFSEKGPDLNYYPFLRDSFYFYDPNNGTPGTYKLNGGYVAHDIWYKQ